MAILVRTNSQTALLESYLTDKDIPYEISKSTSFYDRKEVIDILSYAKIALDKEDNASLRRIYNVPNRFLSKQSLHDLDEFASLKDLCLYDALFNTPQNARWQFKTNVEKLTRIISNVKEQIEYGSNAGKVLRYIVNATKYEEHIANTSPTPSSADDKLEVIDKLCEVASKFPSIASLLAHIVKVKEKQNKNKGKDTVKISTIHSSKGLEWDIVFTIDVNNYILPHERSDYEEERRLLYVACSRPRCKLYVSWCAFDKSSNILEPSPFITELIGEDKIKKMNKEIFRGLKQISHKYYINNY